MRRAVLSAGRGPGAHGDGDPQNTEVPLIAWGAGIRKPTATVPLQPDQVDPQSKAWGLDKYERVDVNQADVAPLMARGRTALVGNGRRTAITCWRTGRLA